MPYHFLFCYAFWLCTELYLNRYARSSKGDRHIDNDNTLTLLWVCIVSVVVIGVLLSFYTNIVIFQNSKYSNIGLILMLSGITFRLLAVKQLGAYFTVDVAIRQNHKLLQTGLYAVLRHPSYTGLLITILGFGISLNNYISLILIFLTAFLAFNNRIIIEEGILLSQFGDEYIQYKSKTKRLFPFIY